MANTDLADQKIPTTTAAKQLAPFYKPITSVPEPMFSILTTYSSLHPDEVLPHVIDIRDRAYKAFPWPCLGLGSFLQPTLRTLEEYHPIVHSLRRDPNKTLLDVGCGLGQDLRALHVDGVPGNQLYGTDLQEEFLAYGMELFRDEGTFEGGLIPGDILDPKSDLEKLDRTADYIWAANFFHVFLYEDMKTAMRRVIGFLKPVPGSRIIGRQMGRRGEAKVIGKKGMEAWIVNKESWTQMWRDVGKEVGVTWRSVDVKEYEQSERLKKAAEWPIDDLVMLKFVVEWE